MTVTAHPMAAGTPPQAPVPPNWQLAAKSGMRDKSIGAAGLLNVTP